MSVDLFSCPVPSILPELANQDCLASYGHIQAIAFQLKQAAPTFNVTSIAALATWTPLLSESDAIGVRVAKCLNFENTPGEAIKEGGNDQTTRNGRPKLKYGGFTAATWMYEGISSALAAQILALTKFSSKAYQVSDLRAFFLTDENYIISGPDFNGIEIVNLFIGDVKKGGGYKVEDNYAGSCDMDYGWSFTAKTTKASFDVLNLANISPLA